MAYLIIFPGRVLPGSCIPGCAPGYEFRRVFNIVKTDRCRVCQGSFPGIDLTQDNITCILAFQHYEMIDGCEGNPPDAGLENIIASDHRHIFRYMNLRLMECIQRTDGHHVILASNGGKLPAFLQKLPGQLIPHGILRIHPGNS